MAEGKVVSLYLCVGHREPMDAKESVVVTGAGLEGDRHAHPQSLRQVLLMEKEILDSLELKPGTIRENVTITGPVYSWAARRAAFAPRRSGGVGGYGAVRAVFPDG